jgi:hypothetical protein
MVYRAGYRVVVVDTGCVGVLFQAEIAAPQGECYIDPKQSSTDRILGLAESRDAGLLMREGLFKDLFGMRFNVHTPCSSKTAK